MEQIEDLAPVERRAFHLQNAYRCFYIAQLIEAQPQHGA